MGAFGHDNAQKDIMAATTGGGFLRAPGQPPTDNAAEVSQALAVPRKGSKNAGSNALRQAAAPHRSDGFNNMLHPGIVNQQVTHEEDSPYTSPKHDAQFEQEPAPDGTDQ